MTYFEMNNMMLIAAAPVINLDAPLPVTVTHHGRATAIVTRYHSKQVVCTQCGSDLTDGGNGCEICNPHRIECPGLCCHHLLFPGEVCEGCVAFAEDY